MRSWLQAARDGDVVALQLLASCGANADAPDYNGRTALHMAAAEGRKLSVYCLLSRYYLVPHALFILNLCIHAPALMLTVVLMCLECRNTVAHQQVRCGGGRPGPLGQHSPGERPARRPRGLRALARHSGRPGRSARCRAYRGACAWCCCCQVPLSSIRSGLACPWCAGRHWPARSLLRSWTAVGYLHRAHSSGSLQIPKDVLATQAWLCMRKRCVSTTSIGWAQDLTCG